MIAPLFPKRGAPKAIARKSNAPARVAFAPFYRSHTAASASALLADWYGTRASANGITAREAEKLRHRARELRENSSLVARYAYLVRTNVIGPDGPTLQAFVPSVRGQNVEASAKVEKQYYAWAESVTPDEKSLVELFSQAAETWKVEGEALGLMTVRDGRLEVECIDPDRLDQHYSEPLRNGRTVEQGIERDARGRVLGYWIWDAAEDDSARRSRRFWSADDVLFLPHRSRPSQLRGLPAIAPVMPLIQHMEKLDEALVVLNRTAASKMFQFVALGDWAAPLVGPDGQPLDPEVNQEEVGPGNQWVPPYGYKAETIDPGQPSGELATIVGEWLRRIASGMNVSEASLTGDLARANYGSQRGGLLMERDGWKMDQQLFIAHWARPLFARWLRLEVLTGRLLLPLAVTIASVIAQSEWHPRRWAWIDPYKDAQALDQLRKMRMTSITRELNAQGIDVRKLFKEIADEEQLAKSMGITLDIGTQPTTPTDPTKDDDDDDDEDDAEKPAATPRSLRAVS